MGHTKDKLTKPLLFLVFNRIDTTKKVFEAIKRAKPEKLYIASDGPRESVEGEREKVDQVRNFLSENIDWACEVKTKFRAQNLGCKYSVAGAIDWFFQHEESGIILEDDCLPNESFFKFCDTLLDQYKEDKRVWHIAGNNFHKGWKRNPEEDYYYSYYGSIWGWATWRDRWEKYDVEMESYQQEEGEKNMENLFGNKKEAAFRITSFNTIKNGLDTWDYQWVYTRLANSGLSIVPNENLVRNLGFGSDATHTMEEDNDRANMEVNELTFPLRRPKHLIRDKASDDKFFSTLSEPKIKALKRKIKKILKQ